MPQRFSFPAHDSASLPKALLSTGLTTVLRRPEYSERLRNMGDNLRHSFKWIRYGKSR